ncbi:hypothetical protein B0J13DRAFT_632743 [Dactylonectria estremocensis]|uniref:Zn(2)-C6 fungal-type domain-containing protein n=1 Tax=Dactylonectria estremocensis TaxID=1079267 RepID=A0A9P9JDZ2_9HYPO|nr:hypothetical protein B0J13DRAFT_632743 [Dactylonectria estremocensis]
MSSRESSSCEAHAQPVVASGSRKGHSKSRGGCVNCKRRKVKVDFLSTDHACDETKPQCAKCLCFGLPCRFLPAGGSISSHPDVADAKDWASSQTTAAQSEDDTVKFAHAEFFYYFITRTGPSLAGSDDPNDPVALFWAHNAPLIFLANPFVLHLAFSLSAYHLIHLGDNDETSRSKYLSLAKRHGSLGLAEMNKLLMHLDHRSCAPLYLSTVLLCFGTFAAGPTGPEDLLVCSVGQGASQRWLPLARGARLILELFGPAVLFSGLMEPLRPTNDDEKDSLPTCEREGFPRIVWFEQLNELRVFLTSCDEGNRQIYLEAFQIIAAAYQAAYGDEDGVYDGPSEHRMILRWLYLMDDSFVERLQSLDAAALLILAYYSPLLKMTKRTWFLEDWTDHLLVRIRDLIGVEYSAWMEWPVEIAHQM